MFGLADGVSAISTNADHSCALKGGGVWCWGRNGGGQLGNGSTTDSAVPVAVAGLAGVSAISTGPAYSCAQNRDGLWCWGRDFAGYGAAGGFDSLLPTEVSKILAGVTISGKCALKDGGVLCWRDDGASTAVPKLESGVSAINGQCALKGGGLWCWNWNPTTGAVGTLPPPPGLESGVSAISADPSAGFGCAIKDAALWCLDSTGVAAAVPGLDGGVSAVSRSCALREGGVWCWGLADLGDRLGISAPTPLSGLESGVSAISDSCALKDGGVWCWGSNSNGQLGNNSPADSAVPVPVLFTPLGWW